MKTKNRIRRFAPAERLFHSLLILSFLILGATGLARLYIETSWGKSLAWVFGGYEACRSTHIYTGIFMIALFVIHILFVLIRSDRKTFSGPDSLFPRFKDFKDFFQHIGWFIGIKPVPEFDRWGYWEKFDYWAVFWGIPILGVTGLLMAYPLTASKIMPGWGLNVALWIHRIEAILAMGHVFIIHFFIAHLRRNNFPMDRTMFEGSSDLAATRHERPSWITRLERAGELEGKMVSDAPASRRAIFYVFGYFAMAFGIYLLVGGLVYSPYITW